MRTFNLRNGVFIKSKDSSLYMKYRVLFLLFILVIYKIFYLSFIENISIIKILVIGFILVISSCATEYLFYLFVKEKKKLDYLITKNLAILPSFFLFVIISINVPIIILIIGSVITSLGKVIMERNNKYIFNPIVIGYLMIILMGNLCNIEIRYDNIPYILLIFCFLYLVIRKSIKWKITLCYIGSISIISLGIWMIGKIPFNLIWNNIMIGKLLFASIFLIPLDVTSPYTKMGEVIYGLILGIMTIFSRYLGLDIMIVILLGNLLTLLINYMGIYLYSKRVIRYGILFLIMLLVIISPYLISTYMIGS